MTGHPDSRALDALSGSERLAALEHLGECAACRREVAAEDPTRLFALLATRAVPAQALDRVSSGVAVAIREGRAPTFRPSPRRLLAASAWAAAAALAAALLVPSGGGAGRTVVAGDVAALVPRKATRAGIEVVASPGVPQVVDLTVGETQIVMIFDPRIEL